MPTSEESFLKDATQLLLSEEVKRFALSRRAAFQRARKPSADILAQKLPTALKQMEKILLPQLCCLDKASLIPPNILQMVGRSWIGTFLREAESSPKTLKTLANKYAQVLLDEALEESFHHRLVIPLAQFSAARAFRFKGTTKSTDYECQFLKTHPTKHYLHGFHSFLTVDELTIRADDLPWATEWVMILDQEIPKTRGNYVTIGSAELMEVKNGLLTALRLYKPGRCQAYRAYISKSILYHSGGIGAYLTSNQQWPTGDPYSLTREDVPKFKKLWRQIERFLPIKDNLPGRLVLALEYFNSSYEKSNPSKLIDLSIALETLFGLQSEQTYRLPIRMATLLADDRSEAQSIFDKVRSVYKTRSGIVHGSVKLLTPTFPKRMSEDSETLCELTRQAILAHLKLLSNFGGDFNAYNRLIDKDFERECVITRGLK